MFFFDMNYLLMVMIPTLILSGLAQWYMSNAVGKWSQIRNTGGYTGPEVAQQIMREAGLNVRLEGTQQQMGDHYDPREGVVRISPMVAGTNSVASMAVVAHELGHVQQHQENSPLIWARNILVPAVQFSPMLAYGMIMMGLLFRITGLAWLGIAFFGVTVIFMLLTLPVEIDASLRGLRLLEATGLIRTDQDRTGARQVLTAAALTYVAAALTSVLTLLYYISLVNRRR